MNAIKFLIKEHNKVRRNLDAIDNSRRYSTKKRMFFNLCQELLRHETMEQEIWYPLLRKNKSLNPEVKHLITEEKTAEKAIKKFQKIKTDSQWEKHFQKLKDDIDHHANEEETELFPEVEAILEVSDLNEIGKLFQKFKTKNKNKKYINLPRE